MALVAVVLVAPSFVNWNGYRGLLAEQLSVALGRQVTISGDMDAALLPRPVFTAAEIRIGDPSSNGLITIETLDARLALAPLLSGHLQIRELLLLRPTAHFTEDSATLFAVLRMVVPEAQASTNTDRPDGNTSFGMAVDFIEIEDGQVEILDPVRGGIWRATGIDSEISLVNRGPITIKGVMSIQDAPLSVDAKLTPLNSANADGVNISVNLIEADVTAKFIGSANRSSDRNFRGDVSIFGSSSRALLETFGLAGPQTVLPAALLQPFSLSAKVRGASDRITTDTLSVDAGGTNASGSISWVAAAISHLELKLKFSAVDVQTWKLASTLPQNVYRRAAYVMRANIFAPAYAAEAIGKEISFPQWLTASVQIRAPLLSYGEDVLRGGVLDASLSEGELTLEELGVTLPGTTRVKAFGFIRSDGETPIFDGALEMDTQSLRGALTWLGASEEIDQVPRSRLSNASLRAVVQGTPSRFSFSDIAVTLDTSSATGTAFVARGERTSFGVDLTIDTLNLDTYVPVLMDKGLRTLFSSAGEGSSDKPDVYGVIPVLNSLRSLANVDADVRINVDALTAGSVPNGRVGLEFGLKDGVLNILSASFGNVAGATLWFSGGLEGFGTTPQFRDFQFDLHADDFGRFARAFGFSVPPSIRGLAPAALTGLINGGLTQADLAATAKIGGMTVNGNGQGIFLDQEPQFELFIEANHPSYAALMQSSLATWPAGATDPGAIALTAQLSQSNAITTVEELKLTIGSASVMGRIAINEGVGRKTVSANFSDIALIYDNLWPRDPARQFLATTRAPSSRQKRKSTSSVWSGESLDWSFLNAWDGEIILAGSRLEVRGVDLRDFNATISVENGAAEISEWDGYLFGTKSQLSLRATAVPEPTLRGEVNFVGGDFASVAKAINGGGSTGLKADAGDFDFKGQFETTGASPRALIENLSGSGSLRLTAASAGSVVVAGLLGVVSAVIQVESIVPGGKNAPVMIDAKLSSDKGIITVEDGAVKSRSYGGVFTGTGDLPNWLIDISGHLRLENLPRADAATQRTLPTSVPITVRGRLDLPNIILNPS